MANIGTVFGFHNMFTVKEDVTSVDVHSCMLACSGAQVRGCMGLSVTLIRGKYPYPSSTTRDTMGSGKILYMFWHWGGSLEKVGVWIGSNHNGVEISGVASISAYVDGGGAGRDIVFGYSLGNK